MSFPATAKQFLIRTKLPVNSILFIMAVLYSSFILWSFQAPLVGVHFIRQADTLFTAYSYCKEDSSFLYPRIVHRENTSGVSIGEFPLFSYVLSLPCKLSGSWSDSLPNYISFLLYLCNILIWWGILQTILSKYVPQAERTLLFPDFFVLMFFSSFGLAHLSIPLPDVFSLFLAGFGIHFGLRGRRTLSSQSKTEELSPKEYPTWDAPKRFSKKFLLSSSKIRSFVFLTLSGTFLLSSFAIRPYMVPLFLLLLPIENRSFRHILTLRRPYWVYLFFLSLGSLLIYWTWYHFWKTKSEILYYNTSIVSPWELVQKFSFVLEGLWNHIVRNQFHFIGFFAFLYVLIRERIMGIRFKNAELGPFSKDPWTLLKQRFFLLAIFSLVFILLFKGTHFVNHGYYLLAHFIFFLFFIFCMVQILPRKIRSVFLFVYALIGVTNTYYLFDPSSLKEKKTIESLLIRNDVKPQEKIAAYLGEESNTTYYLYYAKRMGWALPASKSNELCPQGAAWKLYEKDGILALESCGNPARDSL